MNALWMTFVLQKANANSSRISLQKANSAEKDDITSDGIMIHKIKDTFIHSHHTVFPKFVKHTQFEKMKFCEGYSKATSLIP